MKNCYACHERDGKGGLESAREVYFTVNQEDALGNGRFATHPPLLDRVGAKLREEWWNRVLFSRDGAGSVRGFMSARMPRYRKVDLGSLFETLQKADRVETRSIGEGDAARGHRLVGIEEKHCVACHGLGDLPPSGAVSMNLNETTKRLRPGYFSGFLQNPPFDHETLSAGEVADVWAYLSGIDRFSLPDGLLRPDITELIPKERPIVLRSGLKDISEDALLIGFPSGLNAAFDIEKCRWVVRWKGRFVDPGPDWTSADPVPLAPLEKYRELKEIWQATDAKYLGYDLDEDGNPTIIYEGEGRQCADQLHGAGRRIIFSGKRIFVENWEEKP